MYNRNNKDNNPFEAGKKSNKGFNSNQFEYQSTNKPEDKSRSSQSRYEPKRSSNEKGLMKFFSVPIFLFCLLVSLPYEEIFGNNEAELKDELENISIESIDLDNYNLELLDDMDLVVEFEAQKDAKELVDPNYTYNPDDIRIGYDIHPFPIEIPQGEEFVISHKSSGLIENEFGLEISLVVGEDVKPGVYTIEYNDEQYLRIEGNYDLLHADGSGIYYNIPLLEGDVVKLTVYDPTDIFSQVFTPQSEYVEYQDGFSGVFVYGLSNFDPEIEISASDYSSGEYMFYNPAYNYMDGAYLYDMDVTIYGAPGSYFTISEPNSYMN